MSNRPGLNTLRALTIHQPYAGLIADGSKLVENRTWGTPYRGWLAIHAGKSTACLDGYDDDLPEEMVFGAIAAVAWLRTCVRKKWVDNQRSLGPGLDWLRSHKHTEGPICWVLEDVRKLTTPVPCIGRQGVWVPSLDVAIQVTYEYVKAEPTTA